MNERRHDTVWGWGVRVGRWSAAAYIPTIVVVAFIRAITGSDLAHRWATSPSLVDHGRAWTLFSSALVLDRVQGLQLALAIVLTWGLLLRHGPGALWAALLLGHVGSTLAAYAGAGVAWDTGPRFQHAYVNPDFGISCVWVAILAMLATDLVLTLRPLPRAWATLLVLVAAYTGLALAGAATIAEAEHIFAVTAGISTMLWTRRSLAVLAPSLRRTPAGDLGATRATGPHG